MKSPTKLSIFLLSCLLFVLAGCEQDPATYADIVENPDFYHRTHQNLTDIIVYDIFSPPVASRIYAYPNIAAYEILSQQYEDYQSLAGQLHELTPVPTAEAGADISYPLAALEAFMVVGRTLIFSEQKQLDFRSELLAEFKAQGVPEGAIQRSFAYGQQVAEHILTWADKDNYKQTRTFPPLFRNG